MTALTQTIVCFAALITAFAAIWQRTARQIDRALTEAINRRPWMAQEARRLILTEFA